MASGRIFCLGGPPMPRGKKHGPEEVIPKLREAEVLISEGSTQELAAKQIGVSKQTLIRWRKEYGGFRMDQAKRMKQLEKENAKLKKLLAEAELDKAILKEAASGNF
jgi:putative transposase